MSGVRQIYAAPELYDALHWWKSDDADFIAGWAGRIGGPVLELAAGTGRLAPAVLGRVRHYTGLEISPRFVAAARRKLAPFGDRARILHGDMRAFDLGQTFKFIFVAFNSFLHLYRDRDALDCLTCVRRHLSAGGCFLLEIFVPDPAYLHRPADRLYEVSSFHHPAGGYCTIRESNRYDPATEINTIDWYFFRPLQSRPDHYCFKMRLFYPDTMDRLLHAAGLTILKKFGDRHSTPLNPDSELQIYLCGT